MSYIVIYGYVVLFGGIIFFMSLFSKEDIARVRSAVQITDFLEKQGVSFKQSGVNFSALCPLHSERSPSFHVNSAANTFHCFGCGEGGDVINLVQQLEGLSFVGALQFLAEEAGIVLQQSERDEEYEGLKRFYRACDVASRFFRERFIELEDSHPAKANLYERGLRGEADADANIGFVPKEGFLNYLYEQRVSKDDLIAVGLLKLMDDGRVVQMFRNRLIWTIRNMQGKPIAFSARRIFEEDNGPKYINSPSTRLYNKSKTLMGAEVAKKHVAKTGRIYIVEGATDIMALRAAGFNNVVATCGTAFGAEHAQTLTALASSVKESDRFRAVFCFDGDAAGLKAAREVFNKNPNIVKFSQVVKFEQGDPSEIRQQFGDEKLAEMLTSEAKTITEFILLEDLARWDVDEPEQLNSYVKNSLELLKKNVSPIEYDGYVRKISEWTGVPLERLKPNSVKSFQPANVQETANSGTGDVEDTILALLMQYPNVVLPILQDNNVTVDMFNNVDAETVFKIAEGEKTKTETVSKYLVLEHNVHTNISQRLKTLINIMLKKIYLQKIAELETTSNMDENFDDYFTKMQQLKTQYRQK